MWMKSFNNIFCKSIRLFETILFSSKTMQYGEELFASWSYHTSLAGIPGPDPSSISHPWDILGRQVHVCIPSKLPQFPNLNTSWLNNENVFHKGVGYNSFKHVQKAHTTHS